MSTNNTNATAEPSLVIERVINAPRELVFAAWTEPRHFVKWWGPAGFTTPHCHIDLRVGGRIHFCMRSSEGQEFWCGGVYREIQPPERLVFTDYFADTEGNMLEPGAYGMPAEWPVECLVTVRFEDLAGKTRMIMHQDVPLRIAKLVMADIGWNSSFDRLEEYVAQRG